MTRSKALYCLSVFCFSHPDAAKLGHIHLFLYIRKAHKSLLCLFTARFQLIKKQLASFRIPQRPVLQAIFCINSGIHF